MGLNLSESGVPTVHAQTCTACGQCVDLCSGQVLRLEDGQVRLGKSWLSGCIACGNCMMICPTGSITVSGRGMRPDDCVELPPRDRRATAASLEALIRARRSIRRYKKEPVEREQLDRIIEMAATAPMSIPPHDVGVVVFDGPEKVQVFADDVCASMRRSAWFFHPVTLTLLRPLLGKVQQQMLRDFVRPLVKLIVELRESGTDALFYNAPAAMLFHHTPWTDATDLSIVATYAMLAAESLGLGTCLIGTTVILYRDKRLMAKLGIPPENKTGVTLILGHPEVPFRRAIRRRLASVKYV